MTTATETRKKIKLQRPTKHCNMFYNNEKTTYDAVIHIFTTVFNLTQERAIEKAKEIDNNGKSPIFISSKEACNLKHEMAEQEKKRLGNTHNIHLLVHKVEPYTNK